MKKLGIILLFAVLLTPFMQSCNEKVDQASNYSLATIKTTLSGAGFYGLIDNGETIHIGNLRTQYTPNDGQRAVIYFSELETPADGFTYNADVYSIEDILTKSMVALYDPAKDTLGTEPISITRAWVGGGFMNIEFAILVNPYTNNQNTLNLVDNQIDATDEVPSYFPLEFRHKVSTPMNGQGQVARGVACFRLNRVDPDDYSGFTIKYTSLYTGEKTITIKNGEETTVSDL